MYPHLFRTSGVARFAEAVDAERQAQLAKFGEQHHPDGTGDTWDQLTATDARQACQHATEQGTLAWRDILGEEVYEAFAESDPAALRAELVQVAAVCAAWISDLDQRVYPCTHCGEEIAVDPVRWTWFGPVPEPGQPSNLAPRYHFDRDACRVAGGEQPRAPRPFDPTTDHNA
jgi:protein involved in temperature-dependent protein secretion